MKKRFKRKKLMKKLSRKKLMKRLSRKKKRIKVKRKDKKTNLLSSPFHILKIIQEKRRRKN